VIGDLNSGQLEYFDTNRNGGTLLKQFHSSSITYVKYLFVNGYVACASNDSTVNIWNPKTWISIQKYTGHKSRVLSLDQIDKDTIVTSSADNTIQIWKISTGQTINIINANEWVNSVRVLLNSIQIVCGLFSKSNNVRIYDIRSGNLSQTLNMHTANVNSIEILSDQFMTSGGDDWKIIIWDLNTYSKKYILMQNANVMCIKRLSFNLLASANFDNNILIWNWLYGEFVRTLIGHTGALRFSSLELYDEQTLISGSWDKSVKFWNFSNGMLMGSLNFNIQINSLAMLKKSKIKYTFKKSHFFMATIKNNFFSF
jgi:WD40 repeat protein